MEETVLKPVLHCDLQSFEDRTAHICISPISSPSFQTALSANPVKTSDHVKTLSVLQYGLHPQQWWHLLI